MNVNLDDKIIIKDDSNIEHEYYKLMQFRDKISNKEYLLYTDLEKDDNGLKIYSSILSKDDDNIIFNTVKDDADKKIVEDAVIMLKIKLKK